MKRIAALTFILLGIPMLAGAQFISLPPQVSLTTNPQYPGPNETVRVSAQTHAFDLTFANIRWYVDGALVEQGDGVRTIEITTGAIGSSKRVSVDVTSTDGRSNEASITLTPNTVDLVWEANAYVPPFYKGKTLLPDRGESRVVAIPYISQGGRLLSNDALHFLWKFNGRAMESQSGYGKTVFVNDRSTRDNTISVAVSNSQGKTLAQKSILVPRSTPELILYRQHPVYGIETQRALGKNTTILGNDITIVAEPYFASVASIFDPLLEIAWRVGGKTSLSQEKNVIGIQGEEGNKGLIEASMSVANVSNQSTRTQTYIEFFGS